MIYNLCVTDYLIQNEDLNFDKCSKSLVLEGNEECMSYMIGVVNENGCVIATDSLLTVYTGRGFTHTVTEFKKVFFNEENNVIWGVIGYYGYNEELLDIINDSLKENNIEKMKQDVQQYFSNRSYENATLNIFLCEYDEQPVLRIIDYVDGHFEADIQVSCGAYYAGNNTNMHNALGLVSQIKQLSLSELVEKSKHIIQSEIEIENYIKSKNPAYPVTIGGECIYMIMDMNGCVSGCGQEVV